MYFQLLSAYIISDIDIIKYKDNINEIKRDKEVWAKLSAKRIIPPLYDSGDLVSFIFFIRLSHCQT